MWGCVLANLGVYHIGPCRFLSHLQGEMLCNFLRCRCGPTLGSTILGHVLYISFEGGNAVQFSAELCPGQSWGLPSWAMLFSIRFEGGNAVQVSARVFLAHLGVYHLGQCRVLLHLKGEMQCNFLRRCAFGIVIMSFLFV